MPRVGGAPSYNDIFRTSSLWVDRFCDAFARHRADQKTHEIFTVWRIHTTVARLLFSDTGFGQTVPVAKACARLNEDSNGSEVPIGIPFRFAYYTSRGRAQAGIKIAALDVTHFRFRRKSCRFRRNGCHFRRELQYMGAALDVTRCRFSLNPISALGVVLRPAALHVMPAAFDVIPFPL